ncbi:MAG TPA: Gfo/Idh/MocA family oxidoreductase [Fimbriiglobus sp.]|nr:Gfo/Idh/MocA family oxidoreductase [Fimbriiglobus sp.]
MSSRLNRREFVAGTAASLGYLFTGPAFSVARAAGANDRLRVAGIGVGGKGSSDIDQAGNLMEVVGLCDADADNLGRKAKKWSHAKTVTDYRKLFDSAEFMRNVDAFTVSTPDHNHTLPAALAIKAKKHVYVQKPLTRTVFESHLLRKLAAANGVCSQMGNQGSTAHGLRRAVELVQAGELGPVTEVHVWTNRPIWPQAPSVTKRYPSVPVPKYLDWEAWIGTAPSRPYAHGPVSQRNPKRGCYHDFNWRGWWDFGTGAIGDMACHTANMAFRALKLGHPIHMSAEAGGVNPETCVSWAHVQMKFPARGDLPPVTLHWYEGRKDGKKVLPPDELVQKSLKVAGRNKLVDSGSILVGSKGIAYSPDDYGSQVYFETGAKTNDSTLPEKLPHNGGGDPGQKKEWVEAIKTGKPKTAYSNFDFAAMLTAAFVLGNVAIRTGKAFDFDGESLTASGCPEAARYIMAEYRKGWDLL